MQANLIDCTNLGMVRDTAISKISGDKAEFAYDNRNIRITVNQDNTALSVTNEKGTKRKLVINGVLLGQCILNNQLILFVKDTLQMPNTDCIVKIIEYGDTYKSEYLYSGNLNFNLNHPIETLGYYESESVQKVYWVDGLNPTRFINIASTKIQVNNDTQFDCKGTIYKVPNVTITKDYSKTGNFIGGAVQYFITYYNKFGTETGIVWQSDLQYTTKHDRGCKEGEQAQCVFKLNISNIDTTNYEYLRIYATHRSSQNGTPLTYIVADLDTSTLNDTITYTDDGVGLTDFPTGDLNFIGGQTIIASTLDQKDDTLFLGDITLPKTIIPTDSNLYTTLTNLQEETYESGNVIVPTSTLDISFSYKSLPTPEFKGTYSHKNQLNESQEEITGFKYREVYRFAVQFQTTKGEWTNPIYIGDKYCNLSPKLENGIYQIAQAQYTMNSDAVAALTQWNNDNTHDVFINVRLLVAEVTNLDRRILAQGVINPTMFNYYDRIQNKPYSINSWMFRPRQSQLTNRHYDCMQEQSSQYAEIQGITKKHIPGFDPTNVGDKENSYALLIGLSGDWITNHDIAYVVYKYINDGQIDFYEPYKDPEGNTVQIINDKQGRHNKLVGTPIVRIPQDADGNSINFSTKDKARQWLVENLSEDLGMTDAMIPTSQELKDMARASKLSNNPDLGWSIAGGVVATIAAVALSICTFGAGAGPSIAGISGVWAGILGAIGTVGAAAGTAGVATLAKQLEKAPDVDKTFAKKGFYTLLPEFEHSLEKKGEFETQYSNWLDSLFNEADENGNYIGTTQSIESTFVKYLNEGDKRATLLQQIGRLSFKTPKELDAETKREQYYIDESVVTLNSPDLADNQYTIDNSQALKLDLIGTIPITAVQGDVSMYTATNGVLSNASTLNSVMANPYPTTTIEGLINGPLYQDMELKWTFNTTDKKWPDISPGIAVDSYKIFMWNRDTSWSCYIPGVNIINPMSIAIDNINQDDIEKDYLNYIPAIPKKKVIANLRYSHNTTYQNSIHTLDIESPRVFTQGYDGITSFYSNDTYRTYYGNVNNLSLNTDGYVLLKGNGQPAWPQPEDSVYNKYIYDPISIKFNSTDHALIPLRWDNRNYVILPHLNQESQMQMSDYYEGLTDNLIIEGFIKDGDWITERLKCDTYSDSIQVNSDQHSTQYGGDTYLSIYQVNITNTTTYEFTDVDVSFWDKGPIWYDYEGNETQETNGLGISQRGVFAIHIKDNTSGYTKATFYLEEGETKKITLSPGSYTIIYGTVPQINITGYNFDLEQPDYPSHVILNYSGGGSCTVKYMIDNIYTVKDQVQLNWNEENPYLFIGELVKQYVDYNTWLGGTTQQALQQLSWNTCSLATQVHSDTIQILKTWGDTYYQRWDCMKTFPTTEEDKNSIVDILSFMVESHQNLDGRCDVNRGITNLVNARPTNFNLFNDVYNQTDNLFQYKILDTKFEDNTQENQVVWSLTKNILDNIDKWTQINTVNYLNLNGTYGRLRKIINVNDVLLAFQDTGISTINYNQKAAMSTVEGIPVQLGNTNKVDGYTTVSNKIGCHNKWSINLNSAGLYFIDDYNQSLNRYSTQNGIESISNLQGFTQWFKDNINGTIWKPTNYTAFKLSFDELTKDLYIVNDKEALVYNTSLQRFVSFMDYPKCPLITNYQLNSIALYQNKFGLELHSMFKGGYNNLLGVQQPYWMTYRLNPSTYTDNLFTNFTYIADIIPSGTSLDNTDITSTAHQTFTSVEAWNEYQHGVLDLTTVKNRHRHSKDRFRIWRGDIPRDGDTLTTHINGGNRMRNPWLYLKLYKDTTGDTNKMVFHNLTVTYYK